MSFVETIKMKTDYIGANGRTDAEIAEAEKELGIKFAKDYHEYLKKIGIACFDGHELTGLTNTDRLNVVSVTKELRKQSEEICALWYVVEDVGLDGIIIWQNSDGVLYATAPNTNAKMVADSLSEYYSK